MFNIILFQPEIPHNTGAIARLCVNIGCTLHLIEPLGFKLTDAQIKRSGLDYLERLQLNIYEDLDKCLTKLNNPQVHICTTKTEQLYTEATYTDNCALLFGNESSGLPNYIHEKYNNKITIPMTQNGRSLNLAMSAAIIGYEVWRQSGFNLNPT